MLRTRQTPWSPEVRPPPFGCGPQVSAAGAPDSLRRHAKGGTETRDKCQLPLAGDAHSCMTCAQQKHKHVYGSDRTRSGPPGTSNPSPVKLGGLPLPRPSPFRGRVSIVRPEGCASACISRLQLYYNRTRVAVSQNFLVTVYGARSSGARSGLKPRRDNQK